MTEDIYYIYAPVIWELVPVFLLIAYAYISGFEAGVKWLAARWDSHPSRDVRQMMIERDICHSACVHSLSPEALERLRKNLARVRECYQEERGER